MALTVEQIYKEALLLPDASKLRLTEQLVQYVGTHIDKELERNHVEIAKRRKNEMLSGKVNSIDGPVALSRVRRLIQE